MLLDLWHALDRLWRVMCKTHGACKPFQSHISAAFRIFYKEDLVRAITAYERASLLVGQELEKAKQRDWGKITQHCRFVVPPAKVLLYRFDQVVITFSCVADAKTGEKII